MHRKGFPQSYDRRRLLQFVSNIKSGRPEIQAPTYSHLIHDIVPEQEVTIRQPDIVILEGLNVLQTSGPGPFVSDFSTSRYTSMRPIRTSSAGISSACSCATVPSATRPHTSTITPV
jgi:hypothetical protein